MNNLKAVPTLTSSEGVIRTEKKPYSEIDSLTHLTTLSAELGISPKRHDFNESDYVPITMISLEKLYTDKFFQRVIHMPFITKAGKFEAELFRPLIVFKRPNGKLVVTDGQHQSVLGILYTKKGAKTKVPCQVLVHPSNMTTEECVKAEARFFEKINFNRRNLGQIEKIRAGIAYGDKSALAKEEKLIDMGVHIQNIGDLSGPGVHGLLKLLSAHDTYGLDSTIKAIQLYQKLQQDSNFPKWNDVGKDLNGGLIGGLAAIFYLKEKHLGMGDKNYALQIFLDNYLGKKNPKDLHTNTGGVAQAILIARRIVDACNTLIENDVIRKSNGDELRHLIGDELLTQAGLGDPSKSA